MAIEDYIQIRLDHPRMQSVLAELKSLIHHRYPSATFDVSIGYEPAGVYLWVGIEDDEGLAPEDFHLSYLDYFINLQVEDEIPIYVMTERPSVAARRAAQLDARADPAAVTGSL